MHHTADVESFATENLQCMLEDLRHLVHLESPSSRKDLLAPALAATHAWLVERLGEPIQEQIHEGGNYGDVLELAWDGPGEGEVLFVCHYDTVWPEGTVDEWPMTIDGDQVSGPGTFDMKAGLVQTVWSLLAARHLGLKHPGVRILLNGDEEIGSHASRPHIEAAAERALLTLVTEPSADGHIKTQRKGMLLVDVHAIGVESHAGLNPLEGASAVHALARIVPKITDLAIPERGTTVNVGTFHGGSTRNVVAGTASCQVDIRIQEPSEQERLRDGLQAIESPDSRVKIHMDKDWNRPPMNPNTASLPFIELAKSVAAERGTELKQVAVGGASDANFIAAMGLPVIDGLGAIGAGPHARHEHLLASGFPRQVALITGILLGAPSANSQREAH
ncbi:M20 family metallopeptidase [Arthrobacter pigmenti]